MDTLTTFENKIRDTLGFYLVVNTDRTFWEEKNKFRYRNSREVDDVLLEAFEPMYEKYPELEETLDNSLVLLKQCTWVGMNVPWPVDPDAHIQRVVDNVMEVFATCVYGNLRTEILDLNHEGDSNL